MATSVWYNEFMNYKLYKEEHFHIEKQEHAVETQLAIFPDHAGSDIEDFIWRISLTETMEEESEFAKLPDYERAIMILEGEAILAYEGQRSARLRKLEQDWFDGATSVKCFGRMQSYHLALRKGTAGFVDAFALTQERQELDETWQGGYGAFCQTFYCCEGYSVITFGEQTCMIKEGQLLVLFYDASEQMAAGIMGEGMLIRSRIFYDKISGEGEECKEEEDCREKVANETQAEETSCQDTETRERPEKAVQKGALEDFKECMKLSLTNFRGSRFLFPYLKHIWYDESLKAGIRKIERFYLPMFLWFAGIAGLGLCGGAFWKPLSVLYVLLAWTGLVLFVLSPLMYFCVVPKPVKSHIKRISEMTEDEKAVQKREQEANPMAERILKKYEITGRNVYIEDERPKGRKKRTQTYRKEETIETSNEETVTGESNQ